MVEALVCFLLISFPLAGWLGFVLMKRMYRNRPDDGSFLGKILSSNGASLPPRTEREEGRSQAE